eukprot:SAG22_NODE_13240_length_413_cov_0.780255_1_plen_80_part_01
MPWQHARGDPGMKGFDQPAEAEPFRPALGLSSGNILGALALMVALAYLASLIKEHYFPDSYGGDRTASGSRAGAGGGSSS